MKQGTLVMFDWDAFKRDIDNYANYYYVDNWISSFTRFKSLNNKDIWRQDYPYLIGQVITKNPQKENVVNVYFFFSLDKRRLLC